MSDTLEAVACIVARTVEGHSFNWRDFSDVAREIIDVCDDGSRADEPAQDRAPDPLFVDSGEVVEL